MCQTYNILENWQTHILQFTQDLAIYDLYFFGKSWYLNSIHMYLPTDSLQVFIVYELCNCEAWTIYFAKFVKHNIYTFIVSVLWIRVFLHIWDWVGALDMFVVCWDVDRRDSNTRMACGMTHWHIGQIYLGTCGPNKYVMFTHNHCTQNTNQIFTYKMLFDVCMCVCVFGSA